MSPRPLSLILACLIALPLGACAPVLKVDLLRLATSGRDGWQHPEQVIEALEIEPGDRVAEIGAGDGYWIARLSRAVGPAGRVYAVDVDDRKIAVLHALVEREKLENVEVVRGTFSDPLLPDDQIDLALTCLTYHHIDDRTEYFSQLRRDLSARGRVAHLDDRSDLPGPLAWLPTEGHWSDPQQVDREMAAAGYRLEAAFDFLLVQSFQVFAPEPLSAGTEDAPLVRH